MDKNPQKPVIILFAKSEIKVVSGKQFLVITDKAGQPHKISEKRQNLWQMFNNARDAEPFLLIYETYNNTQYVASAKPITDELLKVAITDIGLKLNDAQTEERNRSTSLSYAKDMVIADKIEMDNLYEQAQKNYNFIKGNL